MYRVYGRMADDRWILWAAFHLESDMFRYWDQLQADPIPAKKDEYGIPYYVTRREGAPHPSRIYSRAYINRTRSKNK